MASSHLQDKGSAPSQDTPSSLGLGLRLLDFTSQNSFSFLLVCLCLSSLKVSRGDAPGLPDTPRRGRVPLPVLPQDDPCPDFEHRELKMFSCLIFDQNALKIGAALGGVHCVLQFSKGSHGGIRFTPPVALRDWCLVVSFLSQGAVSLAIVSVLWLIL